MRNILFTIWLGILVVSAGGCQPSATNPMTVGGKSSVSAESAEVKAAAAFAVKAQMKVIMNQSRYAPPLTLVKILSAHTQVVAGLNYRLSLKAMQNGQIREAEAVVWWQSWRKPDAYRLTAWKWKPDQ